MTGVLTPSQTVGPFFHDCLLGRSRPPNVLTTADTPGRRVTLQGRVLDGDGVGIPDAMVEIWQADAAGRFDSEHFRHFGRSGTDGHGAYRFETIAPGAMDDGARVHAPHISVAIFARGLLNHLFTRVYVAPGAALDDDPLFARLPEERRHTVQATVRGDVITFDVVLQGVNETVFLDFR